MKKIVISLLFAFISTVNFAQAPQKMTYQAVIRDAADALVANSGVGMQISILQSSPTGIAVYIETHNPTSNINGLVTVEIGSGNVVAGSFAAIDWANGPYYLKSETDPTGGTAYTVSGTSQLLSVPYALYAETSGSGGFSGDYNDLTNAPTNVSSFTNDAGYITSPNDADSNPTNEIQTLSLVGQNLTISGGNTVALPSASGGNTLDMSYDQGGAGAGRMITADAGAVEVTTSSANATAIKGANTNTGVAILAETTNSGNTYSTIQSSTNSNSTISSAVLGNSTGAAWGVSGQVQSTATAQAAVYGSNLRTNGGHGVYGVGFNGVVGETNYSQGSAVWGENFETIAPLGNGLGVAGIGYWGVAGEDMSLGAVAGAYGVLSNGDFGATGTKTFIIDHPLDPENKFLRHFSTESNEVLNVYRGNIVLDENGEAIVELPDYYDAINTNPSYNLTPVGGFAQLYVKEEIKDGKFVIAGGAAGLKVSWTIYAERNDPYLQQYPEKREVEVEKREGQQGKYFMPQLYNQGTDKKLIQNSERQEAEQPVLEVQE